MGPYGEGPDSRPDEKGIETAANAPNANNTPNSPDSRPDEKGIETVTPDALVANCFVMVRTPAPMRRGLRHHFH